MRQNEVDALLVAGGPGSADVYHLTSYLPFAPAWVLFPLMGEATIFHHFFNHGPCVFTTGLAPIAPAGGT